MERVPSEAAGSTNLEKRYRCSVCIFSTNLRKGINHHRSKKHGLQPILPDPEPKNAPCQHCNKILSTTSARKKHVREKHPEKLTKSFRCNICNDVFATTSSLKHHQTLFHGEKPCPRTKKLCNICGKEVSSMKMHLKSHLLNDSQKEKAVDLPFNCKHCCRKFRTSQGHKKHLVVIHNYEKFTNEKGEFTCEHCGHKFTRRDPYKQHLRLMHLEQMSSNPVPCKNCGKTFPNKKGMRTHFSRIHLTPDQKNLFIVPDALCPFCGKFVPILKKHLVGEHPGKEETKSRTTKYAVNGERAFEHLKKVWLDVDWAAFDKDFKWKFPKDSNEYGENTSSTGISGDNSMQRTNANSINKKEEDEAIQKDKTENDEAKQEINVGSLGLSITSISEEKEEHEQVLMNPCTTIRRHPKSNILKFLDDNIMIGNKNVEYNCDCKNDNNKSEASLNEAELNLEGEDLLTGKFIFLKGDEEEGGSSNIIVSKASKETDLGEKFKDYSYKSTESWGKYNNFICDSNRSQKNTIISNSEDLELSIPLIHITSVMDDINNTSCETICESKVVNEEHPKENLGVCLTGCNSKNNCSKCNKSNDEKRYDSEFLEGTPTVPTHKTSSNQCIYCSKTFLLPRLLNQHVVQEHWDLVETKYICNQCDSKFMSLKCHNTHWKLSHMKSDKVSKYNSTEKHNKNFNESENKRVTRYPECSSCLRKITSTDIKLLRKHMFGETCTESPKVHPTIQRKRCGYCDQTFKSLGSYHHHVVAFHWDDLPMNERKKCEICNKKCKNEYGVISHVVVIHMQVQKWIEPVKGEIKDAMTSLFDEDAMVHECHSCLFAFESDKKLKQHIYASHSFSTDNKEMSIEDRRNLTSYKLQCLFCKFRADTRESIRNHIRKDHMASFGNFKEPKRCVLCNITHESLEEMKKHVQLVHTSDVFHRNARGVCTLCGKSYAKLKLHYLTVHARDKKVKCTDCKRFFASASQMRLHIKQTHEKVAKIVCDLCGYVCRTKQVYESHMMIHERTVHCRACDFQGDYWEVEDHIKDVHMKDGKYVCPICQKTFGDRQKSFTPHLRNSNCRTSLNFYKDTTIRCKLCSSTFVSDARLRIHMKVHDLQDEGFCKVCNKKYKRLLIHSRSHHKDHQPYKCEWCSSCFKFQRQYRDHMEKDHLEFNMSCDRCGYRCKGEENLQNHIDVSHLESKPNLYKICDKLISPTAMT